MLRRNRFGFRMRRRSMTGRLLQLVVVLAVSGLFVCLLLYAVNFNKDQRGPDFSWLKTRNMSAFLRPGDPSTTLIQPAPPFCRAEDKLRLVVAVLSAPANTERRRVIRKTWGAQIKQFPGVRMLYVFGQPSAPQAQAALDEEHRLHNDVLQAAFLENFQNLTLKMGFLFKWLAEQDNECITSKFLLKVDDDTFVNPRRLWSTLDHALLHTTTRKSLLHRPPPPHGRQQSASRSSKLSSGDFVPFSGNDAGGLLMKVPDYDALPDNDESLGPAESMSSESVDYLVMGHVRHAVPVRDTADKLYLPHRFYPLNIFPRYVGGAGYVVSSSVVPALYQCLLRTPYMNLEDVLITGLCATTQLGLKLTHNGLFRLKKPEVGPDYVCYYKESPIVHPVPDPRQMDEMWIRVLDEGYHCDTFYFALVQQLTVVVEFFRNLFRI